MLPSPVFDEVHVISDLHLGGGPGFQIFGLRQELVGLLDFLTKKPESPRVALVINGDFLDFLAEPPASYFDPLGAAGKMSQILEVSFLDVGKALKAFVNTPGRTLFVNIGNHDMELALPWVGTRLRDLLAVNNPAAAARIVLASEGTGIRCRIGHSEILCVHGNEVDDWNVTDHERIRRIARDLVQGRPVEPWIPNAGTQMVIEVMNEVKRRYPFVDLLKPEVAAVIPTLLALDPGMAARLPGAVPVGARRIVDRIRIATGLLEAERQGLGGPTASPTGRSNAPLVSRPQSQADRKALARTLLDRAEDRLTTGQLPIDVLDQEAGGEFLNLAGAAWQLLKGDVVQSLRAALEGLDKDRSFDLRDADATFRALDTTMGSDISFLLAGHTHLERALPRRTGNGYYYNSGTWARLIKLERDVLQDPARFAKAFAAFQTGRMEALDGEPGLVIKRPTFVSIWNDGALTHAEMRRFDASRTPPFFVVPDSHVSRG